MPDNWGESSTKQVAMAWDDEFFKDTMIYGGPVGPAYSKRVWLHFRDFTTGGPNLIVYGQEWTSPVPIDA